MWSYEGTLTDPATGKVVAEVEGLELVKSLPVIESSRTPGDKDNGPALTILGNLSVKSLLRSQPQTTNPPWDTAVTVLSRRLFCYRRPSANTSNAASPLPHSPEENREFSPYNSLLTSLRLRPDGPIRRLSPIENIAVYDSAVTYVSRNGGREMAVYSERGGRGSIGEDGNIVDIDNPKGYVIGSAQSTTPSGDQSSTGFDFAVHGRRGTLALGDNVESGGPMLPPLKFQVGSDDEVTISPPRSRLLQFGKGDGGSSDRKYGSVRETYTYSFDRGDLTSKNDGNQNGIGIFGRMKKQMALRRKAIDEELRPQLPCSVRYTRYGEAPPWYAPGRSCTLELQGKRIALPSSVAFPSQNEGAANRSVSSLHLPALSNWAAGKCNFWSGWPDAFTRSTDLTREYYQLPPKTDEEVFQQAVKLFCNERQLTIGPLDDYPMGDRKRLATAAENVLTKMHYCIGRVSKSVTMS